MIRHTPSSSVLSAPFSKRALIVIVTIVSLTMIGGLGFWWKFQYNAQSVFADPYICRFLDTNEVSKATHHRVVGAYIVRESPDMECYIHLEGMPTLVVKDSSKPESIAVGGYGGISRATLPSRPLQRPNDTVDEVKTGVPDSSAYVVTTPESRFPAFAVWFSPGTNHTVIIVQEHDRDYTGQDYKKELEALITYTAKAFDHAYRTGETPQPQPTQ